MASIDSLPPDQRAVIELVLQRGRSYDDIAKLVAVDRAAVRERALSAFDALGPQTSVPAEQRALITDYLLGQLPPRVSEQVRQRLAESSSERAWARILASELAPMATGPLPEIPPVAVPDIAPAPVTGPPRERGPKRERKLFTRRSKHTEEPAAEAAAATATERTAERAPRPAPDRAPTPAPDRAPTAPPDRAARRAPGRASEQAPEPGPALAATAGVATAATQAKERKPKRERRAKRERQPGAPPISRTGGAILLVLGAVIVVVVAIVIFASGGGSKHSSTVASQTTPAAGASPTSSASASASQSGTSTAQSSTTSTTPGHVVGQVQLAPPAHGSNGAKGVAQIVQQGAASEILIVASGIPANTAHDAYAVWLSNSPADSRILGFVNPGVGSNGRLQTVGPLPSDANKFKTLLVTLETQAHPKQPGKVVLQGPLTLH